MTGRWRIDRNRLIVSFAVVAGATLIMIGVFGSDTGRDQSNLPAEIEQIEPALGDKVLNQANVVVDLAPGYVGRLEVDGVALPTVSSQVDEPSGSGGVATSVPEDPDTVRFDPGSNTLSYQPRPGAEVERFEVGRHLVKVIYWRIIDGEARSFSYTWYFEVTA